MAGCGGCKSRGNAISRGFERVGKGVSVTKTIGYVFKSGARDLSKLAQASLNKTRRK